VPCWSVSRFGLSVEINSAIVNSSCDCADSSTSGEEVTSGGVPIARVAPGLTGDVVDRDAG